MTHSAPTRAFAYGTLVVPSIAQAVMGRVPASRPAYLSGHAAFVVRGEVYPGAVPRSGQRLSGTLYEALGPDDWKRLDDYEGGLYVRRTVAVVTTCGSELLADCYLVRPDGRHLLSAIPWDLQHFLLEHAANFGATWS